MARLTDGRDDRLDEMIWSISNDLRSVLTDAGAVVLDLDDHLIEVDVEAASSAIEELHLLDSALDPISIGQLGALVWVAQGDAAHTAVHEQGSSSTDASAAGLGECPAVTLDGRDATEARQAAAAALLDLVNRWYDLLERAVDAAMAGEMLPAGERRRTAALCCAGFDEAHRRWETALHIEYKSTGRYPGVVGGQASAMSSWLRSLAPGAGTG